MVYSLPKLNCYSGINLFMNTRLEKSVFKILIFLYLIGFSMFTPIVFKCHCHKNLLFSKYFCCYEQYL